MHKRNYGIHKRWPPEMNEFDLRAAAESPGPWTPSPFSMSMLALALFVLLLFVLPLLGAK